MSLDSIAPLALLSISFVPGYPGSSSSSSTSRCLSGADRATRISPHLKKSDSRLPYLAAVTLRYVVLFFFSRSSLAFLLSREDEASASMIENQPSLAKRRIVISLRP